MIEKALFFALGYYLGSRGARDGLGDLVDVGKTLLKSEEFKSVSGMAVSTARSVIDRGAAAAPAVTEGAWWEAATR